MLKVKVGDGSLHSTINILGQKIRESSIPPLYLDRI